MLSHLARHRWVCFVQGGLTLALGLWLLYIRELLSASIAGTFASAAVLLAVGFVLVASGLLDLAVAFDVTAHAVSPVLAGVRRGFLNASTPRSLPRGEVEAEFSILHATALWWTMGGIALALGCVILASPVLSLHLLAGLAAFHALAVATMDLAGLTTSGTHNAARATRISSSVAYLLCSFTLVTSAFSSDDRAMLTIGAYAAYFGLRMVFLGHQLRPNHKARFAVSS